MTKEQTLPSAIAIDHAFRKHRLGLHFLLAGAKVATGQTPKEVIWTKNKATLYRYVPPRGEAVRGPAPAGLCAH